METLQTINKKYKLFLNPQFTFKDYPEELQNLTIQEIKNTYGKLTDRQIASIKTQYYFRGKNNKQIFFEYWPTTDQHLNYTNNYKLKLYKLNSLMK